MSTTAPKKNIYLKQKDLLDEVIKCKEADVLSDKLAGMFMLLVDRISKKRNYIKYSYLQDMKSEALVSLVKSWRCFDPGYSNMAFSYYTQTVENAFKAFLNKEKDHRDLRDTLLIKNGASPSFRFAEEYRENMSHEPDHGLVDFALHDDHTEVLKHEFFNEEEHE